MKTKKQKKAAQRQRKLQARLAHRDFSSPSQPLLRDQPIRYELAERTRVVSMGGLGLIHTLVMKLKLPALLNGAVGGLLKRHLPYWESDHILALCYNVLTGGKPLQDLNRLRQDEVSLDALGVIRLPAPSTAGDFLRRFTSLRWILRLQEAINQARLKVWQRQPAAFRQQATVDVDGTHLETDAECMEGIDYCAYKQLWGYGPLLITLAETREVLYVVNRSAAAPSHQDAPTWIDRTLALVGPVFEKVWVRGDTDFSLTKHLDDWDERAWFIFGVDAMPNLVALARAVSERDWTPLIRPPRYEVKTHLRCSPPKVKPQRIRQRRFEELHTVEEDVTSFPYRPGHCKKTYRLIVLRKQLHRRKGGQLLGEEIRYFFYITNEPSQPTDELVLFYDQRADQENTIAQLKSGLPAFHAPTHSFLANWAYMVIAALAWNLKAWYGLLLEEPSLRQQVVRMEFKQFLQRFLHFPCQIIRQGRYLIYRIVHFTMETLTMIKIADWFNALAFP